MDPKLAFWTGAWINLLAIVGLVAFGVISIRRGQVSRHRFCMRTSAVLVAAFLASYIAKLFWLGREDLSVWSRSSVWNLRFHEVCVGVMVVAGTTALVRARQMRTTRNVTHRPDDPSAPARVVTWHRRAGWFAVCGAGFGFATAIFVLAGMFGRAS